MKLQSIILCAGKGSRLLSDKSKMLHDIAGFPVCYWSVKSVKNFAKNKPIVVVNYQKEEIINHLDNYFPNGLIFAEQKDINGTGKAVMAALEHLPDNCQRVLIIPGDTPLFTSESFQKIVKIQEKSKLPIAMLTAKLKNPHGYGRIIKDKRGHIACIKEQRDLRGSELDISEVNAGVYVFDREFLEQNINKITQQANSKEFYLTELIEIYIKEGEKLGPVQSIEVSEDEILGVNEPRQLAKARQEINERLISYWMSKGVNFLHPESIFLDASVQLEQGVQIYPNVQIYGQSTIEKGAIIESGSIIKDSFIGDGAHILPYTIMTQAKAHSNCKIGPFAHIRPKTNILNNAKVGNFVEIKASKIGSNSKASHLSYIGDTVIGEGCNIGAGTITCNYDGKQKFTTTIGDNCFIGSNSTLIAPVLIEENSYVAAGSTINQNIPKGTLAFGRARQENKKKITKTNQLVANRV